MNSKKEIRDILDRMEQAALLAAELISKKLDGTAPLANWRKADDSLVTEADIESQALLVSELQGLLPIVGEEDVGSHGILESHSDYLVIDPLDGTTSAKRFTKKIGGQVGYGPIVGLVIDGRLAASVFVNLTAQRGFSAQFGYGCDTFSIKGADIDRFKLPAVEEFPIGSSAILFFAGKNGELDSILKLREQSSLENYYRFGGFANDAMRVAMNYEQIQLQYTVKIWDLPAALLPHETGCCVLLDPLDQFAELEDYRPRMNNPVLIGHPNLVYAVHKIIKS